ncbi:MAG: hypothetical protein ABIP75_20445 [Pyrinomonadaceae bacterium]
MNVLMGCSKVIGGQLFLVMAVVAIGVTIAQITVGQNRSFDRSPETRVQEIIKRLDANSDLRYLLLRGDRGNGPHMPWMDQMKDLGIQQASFKISFTVVNNKRDFHIVSVRYLSHYYRSDKELKSRNFMRKVKLLNLDEALSSAILKRADEILLQLINSKQVKENLGPIRCGIIYANLLDDEILPIIDLPTDVNSNCSESGLK